MRRDGGSVSRLEPRRCPRVTRRRDESSTVPARFAVPGSCQAVGRYAVSALGLWCRRWAKKVAHDTTSGCRFSSARRSRSVMPPQTPNSTRLSRASAAHSAITGQRRHTTAAFLCAAPRTKRSSGSPDRQRAFNTHAVRPSSAGIVFPDISTVTPFRSRFSPAGLTARPKQHSAC
jgi:hypothetical protein